MSAIKELVAFFCAASVMCGAFNILAGKTLEKSFKFVLALIFLCIVVSAITNLNVDFKLPERVTATAKSDNVIALSEYEAEYLTGEFLNENGINYTKIKATANKIEDGGIVINEIKISGATDTKRAEELILNSGICETVKFE